MNDFQSLGLPQQLLSALARINFETPTPIQAKAIPIALDGRDILGSAQTGTGKTAAFAIPMLAKLMENEDSAALIMTPTRELAVQIDQAVRLMLERNSSIRTALLIGGEPMPKQMQQLRQSPRIIIGTPGRINDHLNRNSLRLRNTNFLVLDETDRMLDMGFGVQIDKVLKYLPQERQTLMFSATLPAHIVKMADRYMKQPARIAIGSANTAAPKIKQENIQTSTHDKYQVLTKELDAREGSIIVFVRTKHGADRLARKLDKENHSADAIHGDLRQNRRDRVIKNFRAKKNRILVATDVAARGLDIPHIEHVINYDPPQCPEDYIHRIGRTARAGAEGVAVNLVTPEDGMKWRAVNRLLNQSPDSEEIVDDFVQARKAHRKNNGSQRRDYGHRGQRNDRPQRGERPYWKKPRFERDDSERNEKPASWDFDTAQQESQQKSEFKPRKNFDRKPAGFKSRNEKFGRNRDENRGENRNENRHEGRSEGRNEGRVENRDRQDKGFDRNRKPQGSKRPWDRKRPNRDEARGEDAQREQKREWKPRQDRDQKREWKPRGEFKRDDNRQDQNARGDNRRDERQGSEGGWNGQKRDGFKKPYRGGQDRPQKKEWKPRGEFRRDDNRQDQKPRDENRRNESRNNDKRSDRSQGGEGWNAAKRGGQKKPYQGRSDKPQGSKGNWKSRRENGQGRTDRPSRNAA